MNKVILGLMLVSIMMLALFSVNQNQILQQEDSDCLDGCDEKYDVCMKAGKL